MKFFIYLSILVLASTLLFSVIRSTQPKRTPKVGEVWYADFSTPWKNRVQVREIIDVKDGWVLYRTDLGITDSDPLRFFLSVSQPKPPK